MKRSMDDIYRDRVLSNANEIELSCLAHHGILGQKWGIRRFQNKDGSRTAAGKKRYSELSENDSNKRLVESVLSKNKTADQFNIIASAVAEVSRSDGYPKRILDESRNLNAQLESAAEAWNSDKNAINKTVKEYLNDHPDEQKYSKYYENMEGIDAAANLWSYHVEHTPELKKISDKIWQNRGEFEKASKIYFDRKLGPDANKIINSTYRKLTVSEDLAVACRERFWDLLFDEM